MTGLPESAGATTKLLEVLKDLPLWLMTGLALSAGVLLFVPGLALSVPATARPWIIVRGVVCLVLASARAVDLLFEKVRVWKLSRIARRRFHLSAVPQQSHWSSAKQADDSIVTQVVARLLVKNRTASPIALVRARLISPKIRGEILDDHVSVRAIDDNIYGTASSGYVIPPEMSLPASAIIMIRGVLRGKLGSRVRAKIGVTDDEGHEQKVVIELHVVPPPPQPTSLETVSLISNPIEREVATVLQAELPRYDKCGRLVGGLGSIHLVIKGRTLTGVGNDSWNANSPKNQSISDNPDECELRSDNLEALMSFYGRLTTIEQQNQFATALLDRMDGKAYLRVTYFIVCALWKIGRLNEALERAKIALPQGEIKMFGLSNTLMLINGLLRCRYPEFTNAMLDEIEKFLVGLHEHPFQIPEKIAAIRTARLIDQGKECTTGS